MTSLYLCRTMCNRMTRRSLLLSTCRSLSSASSAIGCAKPAALLNLEQMSCLNHSHTSNQLTAHIQMTTIKTMSTATQLKDKADKEVDIECHPTRGIVVFTAPSSLIRTIRITRKVFASVPVICAVMLPFIFVQSNIAWGLKVNLFYNTLLPIGMLAMHYLLFRSYVSKVYYNEYTKKYTMLQFTFFLKEKVTEFTAVHVRTDPSEIGVVVNLIPYPIANCRINGKIALVGKPFFDHLFDRLS